MSQMEKEPKAASVVLCQAGCGFYGSPATDNLCSKCFKDTLKRSMRTEPSGQQQNVAPSAELMAQSSSSSTTNPTAVSIALASASAAAATLAERAHEQHAAAEQLLPRAELHQDGGQIGQDVHMACSSNDTLPSTPNCETAPQSGGVAAAAAAVTGDATAAGAKKKNRCLACNKRVGLTGFSCRCGGVFCGLHRYSDQHDCQFDYKALGAKEIAKNNPLVVSDKIQKI